MTKFLGASWDRADPENPFIYGITEWLYRDRSAFQEIVVARAGSFGKGLWLDAVIQFMEIDERVYHEHLVLAPLLYHPNPERVLIMGGGDGLALREALKDSRVKEAVLVEIDGKVIDACKATMPDMIQGAFDDPRSNVIVDDALNYLRANPGKFDVVIVDLVDPYGKEGEALYREVVKLTHGILKPDSIVSTHGESAGAPRYLALRVFELLSRSFKATRFHRAMVDSFGGQWGFVLASENPKFTEVSQKEIQEHVKCLREAPWCLVPESFPICHTLPRVHAQIKAQLEREPEIKFEDESPPSGWIPADKLDIFFK